MDPATEFVQANAQRLRVLRWGEPTSGCSTIVCVSGSGFPALTWRAVAELLMDDYVIYAYDRRGHGRSSKPEFRPGSGENYGFVDFADDLVDLLDTLELRDVYAVSHSAGATDALLAAGHRPDLFRRIFAFEPTVAHPGIDTPEARSPRLTSTGNKRTGAGENKRQRRGEFSSREEVFTRYGSRPPFDGWRASALWDYVVDGFESMNMPGLDGAVRLLCRPELEAEINFVIASVIEHNRVLEESPDPFPAIERIQCPLLLTWGEKSESQYRRMTEGAARVIPGAQLQMVPQSTHFLPMQLPEVTANLVRGFDDFKSAR